MSRSTIATVDGLNRALVALTRRCAGSPNLAVAFVAPMFATVGQLLLEHERDPNTTLSGYVDGPYVLHGTQRIDLAVTEVCNPERRAAGKAGLEASLARYTAAIALIERAQGDAELERLAIGACADIVFDEQRATPATFIAALRARAEEITAFLVAEYQEAAQ